REHEASSAPRDGGEKVAEYTGREGSDIEELQVNHRTGTAQLDDSESDEHREAQHDHHDLDQGPALKSPQRQTDKKEGESTAEENVARRIYLLVLDRSEFAEFEVGPEGRESSYRQVNPEDRLPAQTDGQDSTEDETYHGAADAGDEVDPDSLSSLCCWERVCDDGNVVGPDECRAYSLDEAEAYEHAAVLCQAAESRADGEDREASIVEADLAVHVRQPAK